MKTDKNLNTCYDIVSKLPFYSIVDEIRKFLYLGIGSGYSFHPWDEKR